MQNRDVMLVMIASIEKQLETLKALVYSADAKPIQRPANPQAENQVSDSYLSPEEEATLEQKILKEEQELKQSLPDTEAEMEHMRKIYEEADPGLVPNQPMNPGAPVAQPMTPRGPSMSEEMGDFNQFMNQLG